MATKKRKSAPKPADDRVVRATSWDPEMIEAIDEIVASFPKSAKMTFSEYVREVTLAAHPKTQKFGRAMGFAGIRPRAA